MRLHAAHLTVIGALLVHSCAPERVSVLEELNAVSESRHYEVRLDGLDWKPHVDQASSTYALAALTRRLETEASPESRRYLAISYLLGGRAVDAKVLLSAGRDPSDRRAYAASLIAESRDLDDPRSCAGALDVLKPFDDAGSRFNRALALECLGLLPDAETEWNRLLEIDPEGPWREEAAERRERLVRLRALRQSANLTSRVDVAGDTELARFAAIYPDRLFDHLLDQVLARWGDSITSGQTAEAETLWSQAETLAEELDDPWMSGTLREVVSFDRERRRHAAEAFAWHGAARRAYLAGNLEDALRLAESSMRSALKVWSAPFAPSRLLEASCLYLRSDLVGVERALGSLGEPSSSIIDGRVHWLRGLATLSSGDIGSSLRHLELARERFESVGAIVSAGAIHQLMAEVWDQVGWPERAWTSRRDSFASLYGTADDRRWHVTATDTLIQSVEGGFLELAAVVALDLDETAARAGNPELLANARLLRLALRENGDDHDTMLGDALAAIERIPDPANRARLEGYMALLETSRALSAGNLDAASRASARAAATFEGLGLGKILGAARTIRGVVEKRRGNSDLAAEQFRIAATLTKSQQENLDDPLLTFLMKNAQFDLWSEWIEMLVGADRESTALEIVGQASARDGVSDLDVLIDGTKSGTRTVLVYWLSSSELYRWTIDRGRVHFAGRARRDPLDSLSQPSMLDSPRAMSLLADLVFPASMRKEITASTVAIVPSGVLYRVPWSAVPFGERSIVATHDIFLAPGFVSAVAEVSPMSRGAATLVGAPRARLSGVDLPFLPRVEDEVLSIADRIGTPSAISSFPRAGARGGLFHFSGHAVATSRSSEPLLLNGIEARTPKQISTDYAPDLAVLAACESASGSSPGFEGSWSFARGLIERGTRTVVATLWPVDDGRSQPVLDDFYSWLANGEAAHVALSRAQRRSMALGSPVGDWAVWIAIGSPVVWQEAEAAPAHVARAEEEGGSF